MTAEAMAPEGVLGDETSVGAEGRANGPEETMPPAGRLSELLAEHGGFREAAVRAGTGLLLSAAFGLALGARDGGGGLLLHAVGVAAAPASVIVFGVPALYIVLSVFDAPVSALGMARSAGRGVAALGMVLAGLAPLTALYVVSAEERGWGAVCGLVGLMLAGVVGLMQFHASLRDQVREAPLVVRSQLVVATTLFGLLVAIASVRIWFDLVPSFGGGL